MALHTMYGINGVGKDSIAQELRERNPKLRTVTESRILMYLLGITDAFDATSPVRRDQYAQLESTPQERIRHIETQGLMEQFVGNLSSGTDVVLNLSHLVFATYLNGKVEYLTKPKEDWYVNASTSFMQIVAPSEVILDRRMGEAKTRQRILDGVEEIQHHQTLCDTEWARIGSIIGGTTTPMVVIENLDLDKAVCDAEGVIYGV